MSEKEKAEKGIPRAEYRKVKAMNREELSAYLERIWMRGYRKGQEDAVGVKPDEKPAEVAQ